MEVIEGKITDINEKGMTIEAPYGNIDRFFKRKYDTCLIGLNDGRKASDKQIRTVHAFIKAIGDEVGYTPNESKKWMKLLFRKDTKDTFAIGDFSLAECDMTLARDFTKFLLEIISENNITVIIRGKELSIIDFIKDDLDMVKHWVWVCLKNKKCACGCGGAADLHHTPAIGMGFDRDEIVHEGMTVQPLCRIHHGECHNKGQKEFDKYHHLTSVVLDKELCRLYGLKTKEVQ